MEIETDRAAELGLRGFLDHMGAVAVNGATPRELRALRAGPDRQRSENDRVHRGQAARRKEADLVYALFTENGGAGRTMQDGVALFHVNHGNLVMHTSRGDIMRLHPRDLGSPLCRGGEAKGSASWGRGARVFYSGNNGSTSVGKWATPTGFEPVSPA